MTDLEGHYPRQQLLRHLVEARIMHEDALDGHAYLSCMVVPALEYCRHQFPDVGRLMHDGRGRAAMLKRTAGAGGEF